MIGGVLARSWRTWAYEAITYAGTARLSALGGAPGGRWASRTLQMLLAGGSIKVRGGAAFGLRLSTAHLRIDHHQGYGLVRGVLEPSVQEALRRHVRPGAVVYDIGANIGFFSLLGARFIGPAGRVEAFEPVPAAAAAARANAALNGFATITVHEVAVSDHSGVAELLVPAQEGWSHLADRGGEAATRLPARLVALDEQIERGVLPAPDVVKLDVEGSEIAVLQGLRKTLRAKEVTLVCELHETNAEIASLADELGYSLRNLDGTTPVLSAGSVHVLMQPRHSR